MESREIESAIREFLASREIRATGIARVNPIPSVPQEFSAEAVLQGASSVVGFGVPIPKGILNANRHALALHWRYCNISYRFLDTLSNQLCLFLEDRGRRSVPHL